MIFPFRISWIYYDAVPLQDNLVIFPLWKTLEVVFSHDEGKIILGIFILQMCKSGNRVIGLRQIKFYITGSYSGVFFTQLPYHIVAKMIVEQAALFLEWIMRCNHHPYFLQV